MTYTAFDVAKFTRDAIDLLKPIYRSDTQLYEKLAELSGLSRTHIAGFARDPEYSITVSRLDRLANAARILTAEMIRDEARVMLDIAERNGVDREIVTALRGSIARLNKLMEDSEESQGES